MRVVSMLRAWLFVIAIASAPTWASAAAITRCDTPCNANCTLGKNLRCCSDAQLCDGAGPITLNNGADLDLSGFSVTCYCGTTTCIGGTNNNAECTMSSECPGGGSCGNDTGCTTCDGLVTMTDSSSLVKNTGTASAKFTGAAAPAIKCNSKSSSRVTGVRFESINGDGVVNCAKVDENVFIFGNGTGTAIKSGGVASSDFTRDNYIESWTKGIVITGSQPLTVENNFVSMPTSGTGVVGIDVSGISGSGLVLRNNVIFGSYGTGVSGSVNATLTANYCDPTNIVGSCSVPQAPFTLP